MVAGAERRSGQGRHHRSGCWRPAPFWRLLVGRKAAGAAGRIGARIAAADDLAKSIADRQDALASDLANQAEVLENTRFVRQIATSKGETPKPFASINLRGAELGGLYLECKRRPIAALWVRRLPKCQSAGGRPHPTSFSGADFNDADLRKANLTLVDFSDAPLRGADLGGVATSRACLLPRCSHCTASHWSKPDLMVLTSEMPAH